jgi:hypothetical protein
MANFETEEFEEKYAAEGGAEELLEVASAVITDFQECHVEILDVRLVRE